MIVDFEYEINDEAYCILIKNSNNIAYVNKGKIEGFEVSLINMKPVKKVKFNKYFKPIPLHNIFRTIEEAEDRADELNGNNNRKK
ncbi:hypothetical protein [Oceanirhabdus seepicola]|uniref:Uncharacterized protein n=1 Tax=Oceanirhabdus seepicola TaxID=2828781 RepID=A0A9J6PDA5_9CLOT|nr:hypothetical protein [Oceanirhabdus seepicola]MCM1992536.1 hypothetical protein [Oceanirhabdus seepicola]